MTHPPHFKDLTNRDTPWDTHLAQLNAIIERVDEADESEIIQIMRDYQAFLSQVTTDTSLLQLRFSQDTTDAVNAARQEAMDENEPGLSTRQVRLKRSLLESQHLPALKQTFGEHVFNLWAVDVEVIDERVKDLLVREAQAQTRYNVLRGSAKIEFQGETYNLSELNQFANVPDRGVRKACYKAKNQWVEENAQAFDEIFDELVRTRHEIATTLGFEGFIPVGYRRMQRTDYDQRDVEQFRKEVREVVVPLAQRLRETQRQTLGLDALYAWDRGLYNTEGNPKPKGDHDWMVEQARAMFNEMDEQLGHFYGLMADRGYMDLKTREGKTGGGFATSIPEAGMPFIFANFDGTDGDVRVFTHEMGHAFQNWKSADKEINEYHWPTSESAEIHSMSLEFLTWPHMEKFFKEDAQAFRHLHLLEGILFLPYGVAVDHFQHMIYAEPEATSERRREMWLECERMYLPTLDRGDLSELASGRRWQLQLHIYLAPFYYIDYTLAQTLALQFWLRSEEDFAGAMTDYVALCARGGEAPFLDLVRGAGMRSPFEPGSLKDVVQRAEQVLGA